MAEVWLTAGAVVSALAALTMSLGAVILNWTGPMRVTGVLFCLAGLFAVIAFTKNYFGL